MTPYLEALKLDKDTLKQMDCNLVNIAMVLKLVFEQLNAADNADLVLAIGNTGCGKSTMLTSIVFGPGHLDEVTKKVPITTIKKDKETKEEYEHVKQVKRTVIEQSEELQKQGIFKVGHSNAISETFIP
jgi:Tfp pilus assembly pilus retraction ATPase PilT